MSEIHYKLCDVCGAKKHLDEVRYGGVDTWQTLREYVPQESSSCINYLKLVDLCGMSCVAKYLTKRKGALHQRNKEAGK